MQQKVTQTDLSSAGFKGLDSSEFEYRKDGSVAKKDRWEKGMQKLAYVLDVPACSEFEIEDLIDQVARLKKAVNEDRQTPVCNC